MSLSQQTRRWARDEQGESTGARGTTSAATLNRELGALPKLFKLGIEQDRIAQAPVIRLLAEDNTREGFLEPDMLDQLLAHLPEPLAEMTRFAYVTGWRAGEIKTLTWQDVDLEHKRVMLRRTESKNREPRVVPLVDDLADLLVRRSDARAYETATGPALATHVFHDHGVPIGNFRKTWDRARRAVGLDRLLFHDLRRSAIRNFEQAGVSQTVGMQISGHKTANTRRRYRIVKESDIAQALERAQAHNSQAQSAGRTIPAQFSRQSERI